MFLGDKSDALRLDGKQHGGTKRVEHLAKIRNPCNLKLQTSDRTLQFPVCGFPRKNLMLKISIVFCFTRIQMSFTCGLRTIHRFCHVTGCVGDTKPDLTGEEMVIFMVEKMLWIFPERCCDWNFLTQHRST